VSAPVLSAAGLGKCYDLAAVRVRENLPQTLRRLATGESRHRAHWALRGVNFEIERGEIVGLIGPNGAGKSTLLLLLAQIAEPTEGAVTTRGRTDLFFQLGSGLQPSLSVLDNLRLCAALLGHGRARSKAQVDRILEFSGLSDYRHARFAELSSGMAARLPFSVALHGDLDIVLADEAISVGDAAFQARCAEAFKGLRRDGKTVIMATHALDAVRSRCTRAIYLDAGRVRADGAPAETVKAYLAVARPDLR